MPLNIDELWKALMSKEQAFTNFNEEQQKELAEVFQKLPELLNLPLNEIFDTIKGERYPGVVPLEEFDGTLIHPFSQTFDTTEEAKDWAERILSNEWITAVDGSQIYPSREINIPVGLVRVGWFCNRHANPREFIRDADVEVMTPDEVTIRRYGREIVSDLIVDFHRFRKEAEKIKELMKERPGSLYLLDGTLILSYIKESSRDFADKYVGTIVNLLYTSEETESPLVGYIDTSYAKDIVKLITILMGKPRIPKLTDPILVDSQTTRFGDVSKPFICRRDPIQDQYKDDSRNIDYREKVCCAYLRVSSTRSARLEFPKWIVEKKKFNHIIELLRAESIIGMGYPWSLDSAHDEAVIKMADRDLFLGIFQQFSETRDLNLKFSTKATKKRLRRG